MKLLTRLKNFTSTAIFSANFILFMGVGSYSLADTTAQTKPLNNGVLYLLKIKGPVVTTSGAPAGRPWYEASGKDDTMYMIVTGAGIPFSVSSDPGDASGNISVNVAATALDQRSPTFPKPIQSIKLPVVKQLMTSSESLKKGKLYLICCSGDAQTGGGGLGHGDAEYMDYHADGSGAVDIGDGNTDYGVGIDEPVVDSIPHNYKWGPFRLDHTYFTIYEGTGNPVTFLFFDSFYGDNSTTDTLNVTIYPLPK